MSDVAVVPDCVKDADIRKGRFIILGKLKGGILIDKDGFSQTSCIHVARDYGNRGYTVWKLSGANHIPPFKAFGE